MGFSLRSRYKWDPQPGGRQRNATWGREEPWGGQQTTGSRKREMEEEVVGGGRGGQRPRSKGAREDSLQVSTLPTNIPRSAKYCCFPGRPKLETVSAHNLGRGPGSLLCLPCPMRGPRAEVRRSSLMGGWRAGLVLNVHLAPQQQRPPLHTIHKGTQTPLPPHGTAPSAAHSSQGAESRVQGCGGGGAHIRVYIYITLILCTKSGRRKREGGTLLGHHNRPCGLSPHPTGPQPAPGRLAGSHLIGVCVVGGSRILSLRLIHGALCCPHGCILGRLLHVRVLPCSRGPLLLSFAETPPAAPVEFMDL